jgi:hypothetical protein
MNPMSYYDHPLIDKAVDRFWRLAKKEGYENPSIPNRHLCTLDGSIVHLRNINGLLARFIVREDGSVRRLKTSEAYRDWDYERTFLALPGPYSRGKPTRK